MPSKLNPKSLHAKAWDDGGGSVKKTEYSLAGKPEPERRLSRAPKSRVCYICGRMYMVHSFAIHEPQCRKLFEDREALKPVKERKACPSDPASEIRAIRFRSDAKGGEGGVGAGVTFDRGFALHGAGSRQSFTLEELNEASQAAYSSAALSACRYCGRTMLPEKLGMHNKLCTREHPARRVGEGVRVDRRALKPSQLIFTKGIRVPQGQGQRLPQQRATRIVTGGSSSKVGGGGGGSDAVGSCSSWRGQSNAFRAAIKNARRYARAEKLAKETGESVDSFLVPPSAEEQRMIDQASGSAAFVECASCGRSFSEKAADRHIPLCAGIQNKPSRLMRGGGNGNGIGSGAITMRAGTSSMDFHSQMAGAPRHISDNSATGSVLAHALVSSRHGARTTVQPPAWETRDSGIAVYEKPRIGRQQRVHPSPPVENQNGGVRGPEPYGLSKHVSSGSAGSVRSRQEQANNFMNAADSAAALRVSSAKNRSSTTSNTMATAQGDLLQQLMDAKQKVAAGTRVRTIETLNASLQRKRC